MPKGTGTRKAGKEMKEKGRERKRGEREEETIEGEEKKKSCREEKKESFVSYRHLVNPTGTGTEQGLKAL